MAEMRGVIDIQFDEAMLADVTRRLGDVPADVDKTVAGSINDALRFIQRSAVAEVNKHLVLTKRQIRDDTKLWLANKDSLQGRFTFRKRKRIPIRPEPHPFKARQTRKGVTYRTDRAKGRQFIAGAFGPDIKALGFRVFKRAGKKRFPLKQLRGPSPWGVFVKRKLDLAMRPLGQAELTRIVEARIKLMTLRRQGAVPEAGNTQETSS